MAKLGDICEVVSGSTPKTNQEDYWNGQFCWVTPAEISDSENVIYDTERKITEKGAKSCSLTLMPVGTVLLSSRAPIGKVAITGVEMYCNQGFKNLICKNNIFNRYLYWFLKGKTEYLNSLGRGATFKEISKKIVSEIEVPLPKIEIQHQIADNLDKVTRLIDLCNTILEKLDFLVKARFVEMFGDPFINPLGWDEVNISDVVDGKASNGFFSKRDDYIDDGNVAVLGVAYVVNRMYSQVFDLPRTNAAQTDIEKFSVKYGDMLFCRSSLVEAGIGKASIVPENTPNNILFECHVIRLPLDLNKCIPEYMQVLSTMDYFRNQMISQSKTATMTTISQEGIMNANIILPPLEKQKMFYDYVKQTHTSKLAVKKVHEKAETLKKSLMQKYFW